MQTTVYQVPIDWRRVQFSLMHPDVSPVELGNVSVLPRLSLMVPIDCIGNVRELRDWLHYNTEGYSLFGCYHGERFQSNYRSSFQGIIVVFHRAIDAVMFRLTWNTQSIAIAA